MSFNHRVLQEAIDPRVPLIDRIRFLGIFSNNLDEFFRVRVATVKRMIGLGTEVRAYFEMDPKQCLNEIQEKVLTLQNQFEKTFQSLIQELAENGVNIKTHENLSEEQSEFVGKYFYNEVLSHLVPILLGGEGPKPQIQDHSIYLAIKLWKKKDKKNKYTKYALMEMPETVSRFLVLPNSTEDQTDIILLDDVIRHGLPTVFHIFEFDHVVAHTIKLTRDAELDIEEDISSSLMEKLERSLERRKSGQFVRFVYDESIPDDLRKAVEKKVKLSPDVNRIPGGRYHNFKDFIGFPSLGRKSLNYQKLPAIDHPDLAGKRSILDVIDEKDILLTYPFQKFGHVIDLLREAAMDPSVTKIKINLYRVAKHSKIINALINAVKNGKKVLVVLELQARFDEKNNLKLSQVLQDEGVQVQFGVQGLKVHSKLILIERKVGVGKKLYAHIGTGNFHEGNASIYTDHSLLTADERITKEVKKVFNFLKQNYQRELFRHLLVSPFNTRRKLMQLIHQEIKYAKEGKEAYIYLKVNNLVDSSLIRKLYEASQAGVKIHGVVRGICALIPGVSGMSDNIHLVSVVDRFLEHTRLMIFSGGGNEKYFITSADWMTRNLDRRVEVGTPIYDKAIQEELKELFLLSYSDNVKARRLDKNMENKYLPSGDNRSIRSQIAIYHYFKEKFEASKPVEI